MSKLYSLIQEGTLRYQCSRYLELTVVVLNGAFRKAQQNLVSMAAPKGLRMYKTSCCDHVQSFDVGFGATVPPNIKSFRNFFPNMAFPFKKAAAGFRDTSLNSISFSEK